MLRQAGAKNAKRASGAAVPASRVVRVFRGSHWGPCAFSSLLLDDCPRSRPAQSGAEAPHSPAMRIRVNLSKAPEWFLGAAISRVSKSLGRCSLWQSPLLSSAPRSRSVWSAAVDRRFPRTVLRAFPFKSGAEAHALQALRATEHAHAQAASAQGPHLSRPKVDAYARCGTSPLRARAAESRSPAQRGDRRLRCHRT